MTQIVIEGDLAERLLALAAQGHQPVDEFLEEVLAEWGNHRSTLIVDEDDAEARVRSALELIGALSGPADLSSTVHETMKEIFADKSRDSV